MDRLKSVGILLIVVVVGSLLPGPSAQAALVAFDDFESYALGDLNGNNGGSGWTNAWAAQPGIVSVVSPGLSYSNGSISVDGGSQAVSITGSNDNLMSRRFETQNGSELWFSFLFQPVSNPAANDFLYFWIGAGDLPTVRHHSGGMGLLSTTGTSYGARLTNTIDGATGSTNLSSTTAAMGTTVFLVGRISTDGSVSPGSYNLMQMWINPTSMTLGGANATVDFNSGFTPGTGISAFGVRTVNVSGTEQYRFDELRVGTDFASVVPEPSTCALLIGGVGAVFLLRRKVRRA